MTLKSASRVWIFGINRGCSIALGSKNKSKTHSSALRVKLNTAGKSEGC